LHQSKVIVHHVFPSRWEHKQHLAFIMTREQKWVNPVIDASNKMPTIDDFAQSIAIYLRR